MTPVGKPGVNKFEARQGHQVLEHIETRDLPQRIIQQDSSPLVVSEPPNDVSVHRAETFVKITRPNFAKGQWGVSDGRNKFFAQVEDKEFLQRVSAREIAFHSGDTLKVLLRTEQTMEVDSGKLKTSYIIERVIEHNSLVAHPRLALESKESKPKRKALPPARK